MGDEREERLKLVTSTPDPQSSNRQSRSQSTSGQSTSGQSPPGQSFEEDLDQAYRYELDWTILMARAQDGDSTAYLRLLEEITPYLRSRAARYHRDPRDIEDTVQDILLTVHSVRQTYDPTRPFGPWLVGIANRRAFNRLRRQGQQRLHELPLTSEHEEIAATGDSHEHNADRRRLEGAISDLPPAQQQAIRMLKLKEMSLKEAATASGMSITSLKVATHRALKSLRKMLIERGEK